MRICEAGACLQPAVWRGPKDERHAAAWCDLHRPFTPGPHASDDPGIPAGVEPIPKPN